MSKLRKMQFIQVDTRNDIESNAPGTFRQERLYNANSSNYNIENLLDSNAVRSNLFRALRSKPNWMLTCCTHGKYDEIIGYDGRELLQIPENVNNGELERVIHLKCCDAADSLGPYLVSLGCWAFFGYDVQFGFPASDPNYAHLQDCFFEPDLELVETMAQGNTAEEAHKKTLIKYAEIENKLLAKGNPGNLVGVLNYNKKHFCSPTSDPSKYGLKDATIYAPGHSV